MNRLLISGANRGIGLELTRLYAEHGDRVFAGCRSPEQAQELDALSGQYPGQISILPLEITDEACIDRCVLQVMNEANALDILINNAAINDEGETISTFDADQANRQWQVNAVGQLLVTKKFLGLLKTGNAPKIINITSEAGSISRMDRFRGYYYFASKAAMNMFTRCLAWDPETDGITTIAMHPGWVRTDMGGPMATLSTEESAKKILSVVDRLSPQDSGKFYTYTGDEYPW